MQAAKMNTFCVTIVGLLQLLLVIGVQPSHAEKRVLCFYAAENLEPEDIDVTLCTHLMYDNGKVNIDTGEVVPRNQGDAYYENDGKGYYDRLTKLKDINPKLKVLLYVMVCCPNKIPQTSYGRSIFVRSAVAIFQKHGFDGLVIDWIYPKDEEKSLRETYFASLLNDLRAEFDKHGFLLSVLLPTDNEILDVERDLGVIVRTCDFVSVNNVGNWGPNDGVTGLFSSLTSVKSGIDIYLSKNVPANKMLILISTMGIMVQLDNVNETSLGAEAHSVHVERVTYSSITNYGELVKWFGNQTQKWVIHRDEVTKSPYASNKDGLWVSYDDPTSVAAKCRYVVENNLGGAIVMTLCLDDYEGNGGEGAFPLIRTTFNTLTKKLETDKR